MSKHTIITEEMLDCPCCADKRMGIMRPALLHPDWQDRFHWRDMHWRCKLCNSPQYEPAPGKVPRSQYAAWIMGR